VAVPQLVGGVFSINPTFLSRAVHVHRTLFFAIPTHRVHCIQP
jgi:hypothetical protein